jgi:hypothetical protein
MSALAPVLSDFFYFLFIIIEREGIATVTYIPNHQFLFLSYLHEPR